MCRLCESQPHGLCPCGCGRPIGKNGCTSHSKRSKVLCNGKAVRGRCTCRMHKGTAKRGPASHAWKHGLYSTTVPARYAESAVRTLNNPDSFTSRQQVALMDARSSELFAQMSKGGTWEQFASALMIAEQLGTTLKDKKQQSQHEQLMRVLNEGVKDSQVWKELLSIWEERRRAIDTDSKVQFRQRVAMSQEQAAALAAIVIQAAFELLPDDDSRQKFADRVEANSPGGVLALTRGSQYDVS